MRILISAIFFILTTLSKPGELVFSKSRAENKGESSNSKPFVIYSHRYQMNSATARYSRVHPGTSIKVGLDEYRSHIIGYAEPADKGYILLPFIERGPYKALGEQRIKMIINGEDARKYETLLPAEKLNDLFFKTVQHLADAVVVAHPNPNPKLWD